MTDRPDRPDPTEGAAPPPLALARLSRAAPTPVLWVPDAAARAEIAAALDLLGLRKLRLAGALHPEGARDWRLEATLGATVVQPCVVTLAPVTTRIDAPVLRRYLAAPPGPGPADPEAGGEVEMPEDDSIEALPDRLDLGAVLVEALALALPDYPRAEGAGIGAVQVAEPGVTPMTDEAAKPLAGLAALRDRIAGKTPPEEG